MYALTWAENVVTSHYRLHARASYSALLLTDIHTRQLVKWLQKNDPRWNAWKKFVLLIEDVTNMGQNDPGFLPLARALAELVQNNPVDGSNWLLTAMVDHCKLKERSLKVSAEADSSKKASRDLPGQLLLFPEA